MERLEVGREEEMRGEVSWGEVRRNAGGKIGKTEVS